MFVTTANASARSWRLGYALGCLHLALSVYIAFVAVGGSHDALWQMIWAPLMLADLPLVLVCYPLGFSFASAYLHGYASWSDPQILVPLFTHGVIGSLLYAYIPPSISAHRYLRASRRAGKPTPSP